MTDGRVPPDHATRWDNGLGAFFLTAIAGMILYLIHYAWDLATAAVVFAKLLAAAIAFVVGFVALVYVLGFLVTDVPYHVRRWFR